MGEEEEEVIGKGIKTAAALCTVVAVVAAADVKKADSDDDNDDDDDDDEEADEADNSADRTGTGLSSTAADVVLDRFVVFLTVIC